MSGALAPASQMVLHRSPRFAAALLMLWAWLASPLSVARAQERPVPRGTHFLLEGGLGTSLSPSPRPVFDVSAGVGARLYHTPLRGYLLTQLGYLQSRRDESSAWPEERRQDLTFGMGLRVYVSLPDRLRLHVDVLGGGGLVRSELARSDGHVLREDGWFPQLTLSPGLQYRLYRELSLGVRAKWVVSKTGLDAARDAAGIERRHPWSALAGITWHF